MTAKASYKKGKSTYDKEVWIISVHTSAGEIMANDRKTMGRLEREFYGNSKAKKHIIIREILTKKYISNTNSKTS